MTIRLIKTQHDRVEAGLRVAGLLHLVKELERALTIFTWSAEIVTECKARIQRQHDEVAEYQAAIDAYDQAEAQRLAQ